MPEQRNRGQIQARGERKWLVRVYLGMSGGKRQYASETVQGTYKQAEQALTRKLRELDTHTFVKASGHTVEAYLDEWLAGKVNISPRSRIIYDSLLRTHILPALGAYKLKDLTGLHVSRFYASLDLKPATVKVLHGVLNNAMEAAVGHGYIAKNPCSHVEKPRMVKGNMQVLTPEQAQAVIETNKHEHLGMLWEVLLTTGMRPGEAKALTWDCFEGDRLSIRGTLVKTTEGFEVDDPKTSGSRRTVVLPRETAENLRAYRLWMGKEGLNIMSGYIFADSDGQPLKPDYTRRQWARACKAAGVPKVRLYTTRHSHVTHMLMAGVNPKVAAERVGHSSIKQTMDTYSHVLPEMEQKTADTVSELLYRKTVGIHR